MVKRGLLIGINYYGQSGQLSGCIHDVQRIQDFLQQNAFDDIRVMCDDVPQQDPRYPNRQNIEAALQSFVYGSQAGDSLFFHFSGHGVQQYDRTRTEEDGMDECLVPVDFRVNGVITDDFVHQALVNPLPAGVRLTCICDCCHSGTIIDLPFVFTGSEYACRGIENGDTRDVHFFPNTNVFCNKRKAAQWFPNEVAKVVMELGSDSDSSSSSSFSSDASDKHKYREIDSELAENAERSLDIKDDCEITSRGGKKKPKKSKKNKKHKKSKHKKNENIDNSNTNAHIDTSNRFSFFSPNSTFGMQSLAHNFPFQHVTSQLQSSYFNPFQSSLMNYFTNYFQTYTQPHQPTHTQPTHTQPTHTSPTDTQTQSQPPPANFQPSTQKEVILISGCSDSQTSADVSSIRMFNLPPCAQEGGGGACTSSFLGVMAQGKQFSYVELINELRRQLASNNFKQVPQLSSTRNFDLNAPFAI